MASKTSLLNNALAEIGTSRVSDFDTDKTREANIARDCYDQLRRKLLRMHPWNWATFTEKLAQISGYQEVHYKYAYALPSDYIRTKNITQSKDLTDTVPYKIESIKINGEPKRAILSDCNVIYLTYVADIQDVNFYAPDFADTLSLMLALRISKGLKKSAAAIQIIRDDVKSAIAYARSCDSIEDYPDQTPMGSWASSRQGLGRNNSKYDAF